MPLSDLVSIARIHTSHLVVRLWRLGPGIADTVLIGLVSGAEYFHRCLSLGAILEGTNNYSNMSGATAHEKAEANTRQRKGQG